MISDNAIRDALADMLGILQQKVKNGSMNQQDVDAIVDIIQAGGGIQATAEEIARYYNKKEDDVRHLIHRNIFPAPRRRVYYDFAAFQRLVPARWRKKKEG